MWRKNDNVTMTALCTWWRHHDDALHKSIWWRHNTAVLLKISSRYIGPPSCQYIWGLKFQGTFCLYTITISVFCIFILFKTLLCFFIFLVFRFNISDAYSDSCEMCSINCTKMFVPYIIKMLESKASPCFISGSSLYIT